MRKLLLVGSDTICRIIANKLGPALGQPVVALAALYVHHRPAEDVNYDPVKDFVPITRVGSFTLMATLMATNSPLSADPFLHRCWSSIPTCRSILSGR
jgi:hypothetical protein